MPSIYALLLSGFIGAFSANFAMYAVSRVLIGFCLGAIAQVFVYVSELVGPKFRPFAGLILWIFTSIGFAIVGVIAYYVRRWKMLVILCTAPFSFTLIFFK